MTSWHTEAEVEAVVRERVSGKPSTSGVMRTGRGRGSGAGARKCAAHPADRLL
jgi:hypothetical protein